MFNQLKDQVLGQQYKTLRELLEAIHKSFEKIQPENLRNYNKLVLHYLYQCLERKEIHSGKQKLDGKEIPQGHPSQKWDIKHRQLFATERIGETRPIRATDADQKPLAKNHGEMVKDGVRQAVPYGSSPTQGVLP